MVSEQQKILDKSTNKLFQYKKSDLVHLCKLMDNKTVKDKDTTQN